MGIADVEYAVANSGGTTACRVAQTLINNTGQLWTDFHFELGFGIGVNFNRSLALDFLDFDLPGRDPTPTTSVFPFLNHQADTLEWSGGTVPSIGVAALNFSVDG